MISERTLSIFLYNYVIFVIFLTMGLICMLTLMFCEHEWVFDDPIAYNARYCSECGKTQWGHMIYEGWLWGLNGPVTPLFFKMVFGHDIPQVVKDRYL